MHRYHLFAAVLGILLLGTAAQAQFAILLPTNNDPTNQIRFHSAAEADAKREQLIHWIWDGGLPTSVLPTVTHDVAFTSGLNGIDPALISRIDRLDADVSGMDFHSVSYLMHPVNTAYANHLAIVSQGHADALSNGIDATINRLLAAGYSVIAMHMPCVGWNADTDVVLPNGTTVNFYAPSSNPHNDMFSKLIPPALYNGAVFRFFLEPVVQNINYFQNATDRPGPVTMIGLSGGGWTTSMAAAVDTRIALSVPVAGSAPFYVRNKDPMSYGDAEQNYAPLYDENIAPDGAGGGIATWQEIYALGGYGENRRQIMVTNQHDIYFSGSWAYDFAEDISSLVANDLGKGQWEYVLDSTWNPDSPHEIFPWTQEYVIMRAMPTPEPSAIAIAMTGFVALSLHRWRKRNKLV